MVSPNAYTEVKAAGQVSELVEATMKLAYPIVGRVEKSFTTPSSPLAQFGTFMKLWGAGNVRYCVTLPLRIIGLVKDVFMLLVRLVIDLVCLPFGKSQLVRDLRDASIAVLGSIVQIAINVLGIVASPAACLLDYTLVEQHPILLKHSIYTPFVAASAGLPRQGLPRQGPRCQEPTPPPANHPVVTPPPAEPSVCPPEPEPDHAGKSGGATPSFKPVSTSPSFTIERSTSRALIKQQLQKIDHPGKLSIEVSKFENPETFKKLVCIFAVIRLGEPQQKLICGSLIYGTEIKGFKKRLASAVAALASAVAAFETMGEECQKPAAVLELIRKSLLGGAESLEPAQADFVEALNLASNSFDVENFEDLFDVLL